MKTPASALLAIACGVLLTAGFVLFGSAGRDDAHITYWPAYTLASSGQMVNYNGDRVEQSSSLLHVLSLAALVRMTGGEAVTLGKPLSAFFGAACVVAVFVLVRRIGSQRAALAAAFITATFPYLVYWAYGGLETTLAAFLGVVLVLTLGDYCARPTGWSLARAVIAIACFELVRPDTPIVLLCLLCGAWVIARLAHAADRDGRFRVAVLFSTAVAVFGAIVAFRVSYFGSAFPQPVSAKSSGPSLDSLKRGVHYVADAALFRATGFDVPASGWSLMMLVPIALAAAALWVFARDRRDGRHQWHVLLAGAYVVSYLAVVVFAGGDWMEGGRMIVPLVPVTIAFLPIAIERLTPQAGPLVAATLVCCAVQLGGMVQFARAASTGFPLWAGSGLKTVSGDFSWFETHNRVNARDIAAAEYLTSLVATIARHHTPVTVLSGQMGMVAYHVGRSQFGRVRFIDLAGLVDRSFTRCAVTRNRGRTPLGLRLSYATYFKIVDRLVADCGFVEPDVIYDIQPTGRLPTEELTAQGYTVVFAQDGVLSADTAWLPGRPVQAGAYIAMRTDLRERMPEVQPVSVHVGR